MPRTATIIPELSSKDLERFWAKVNKEGPIQPHCPELGNCWEWTAAMIGSGYGNFWSQGDYFSAHRVGFFIQHNKQPNLNFVVLHRCDNKEVRTRQPLR